MRTFVLSVVLLAIGSSTAIAGEKRPAGTFEQSGLKWQATPEGAAGRGQSTETPDLVVPTCGGNERTDV